jgi:hypothetical protein
VLRDKEGHKQLRRSRGIKETPLHPVSEVEIKAKALVDLGKTQN